MLQLIKKDIITQRSFAYFAPLFLLPYFLTIGNDIEGSPLIVVIIFSMSIAFIGYFMVMYSNFSTNEGERVQNRLLLSLPINRKEIIIAKYATILFWWFVSFISYMFLFYVLGRLFDFGPGGTLDLRIIPLSLCFTYVLSSVFYPLQFKFGYRAASLIGILMFFAITSSVGKVLSLRSGIMSLVTENPVFSIIVFSLIVSIISFLISLKIFQHKDY